MAIMVTGGAGFIGSHMVWALRDAGRPVVVVDDLSTGRRAAVPRDVPFIRADAGDEAAMLRAIEAHGVDTIIHFAARIVVPDSVADPLGYYLANTVKSRALFAAAVAGGVRRIVFSSTAAVYGIPDRVPVREDDPVRPLSPYGLSKLVSEWMLRDAAGAHDLGYVALRYFNVAGADPAGRTGQSTPNATHLLKVAIETALGRRTAVDVFGTDYPTPDGTGVRDYIHVTDLIAAHLAALDHLERGGEGGVFNCGYGRGHSVLDVIETVRRVSGRPVRINERPRRPGDPPAVVADAERCRRVLGWTPRFDDLSTMVEHALRWETASLAPS